MCSYIYGILILYGIDMSVEGVFRKNGNIRRLKEMAAAIDTGSETLDLPAEGPVQVAALLKRFLRDLPDPLLTYKLHRLFITSQSKSSVLCIGLNIYITKLARARTENKLIYRIDG